MRPPIFLLALTALLVTECWCSFDVDSAFQAISTEYRHIPTALILHESSASSRSCSLPVYSSWSFDAAGQMQSVNIEQENVLEHTMNMLADMNKVTCCQEESCVCDQLSPLFVMHVVDGIAADDMMAAKRLVREPSNLLRAADVESASDEAELFSAAAKTTAALEPFRHTGAEIVSHLRKQESVVVFSGLSSRLAEVVLDGAQLSYKNISFSWMQRVAESPSSHAHYAREGLDVQAARGKEWAVITSRGGVLMREPEVEKCALDILSVTLSGDAVYSDGKLTVSDVVFDTEDTLDRMVLMEMCVHDRSLSRVMNENLSGAVFLHSVALESLMSTGQVSKARVALAVMDKVMASRLAGRSVSGLTVYTGGSRTDIPSNMLLDLQRISANPADAASYFPAVFVRKSRTSCFDLTEIFNQKYPGYILKCLSEHDVTFIGDLRRANVREDANSTELIKLTKAGYAWGYIYNYQITFWTVVMLIIIVLSATWCMCSLDDGTNNMQFLRRAEKIRRL